MNEGLVLLAAWTQWVIAVVLLVVAVARRVEHVHEGDDTPTYTRKE